MRQLIHFSLSILVTTSLFSVNTLASDFSQWLSGEAKDIKSALAQFDPLCRKKHLDYFLTTKSPREVAVNWTEAHCRCMHAYLEDRNDLVGVQVINAQFSDRLIGKGNLPGGLDIYLSNYTEAFRLCEADANWRTGQDPSKPQLKSQPDNHKKLPFRPQKNPDKSRKINPDGVE